MPQPVNRDAIGLLYCRFMEEIVIRDELILNSAENFIPPTYGMKFIPEMQEIAVGEFCYLQLRMICELVALGCLTAHGDIAGARSQDIRKARYADWIINALGKLHPQFFPVAGKQFYNESKDRLERVRLSSGYLTKAELLELYHECGAVLHRGSFREIASRNRPEIKRDRIRYWQQKLWTLLSHHEMDLIGGKSKIIGLMKTRETQRPQFSFWKMGADGDFYFESSITPVTDAAGTTSTLLTGGT